MQVNDETYQEIKQQFNIYGKKNGNEILVLIMVILGFVFLVPLVIFICLKSSEYVDNFYDISEPIQTPVSGGTIMYAYGDTITVEFLAEYDIKGRVLATAQYGDNIFERVVDSAYLEDKIIRYKDVGIGWGFLTQDDYVNRFKRTSLSRYLLPEYKSYDDYLYVNAKFSLEEINRHMSHNHLIPANDRIKMLLRGIRKGQYVHIKGYLVRLHSGRGYNLTSSLTRDDVGDGACETIYVTDVTWLKQKNKNINFKIFHGYK